MSLGRRPGVQLTILVLAGAALRAIGLGDDPLWLDEANGVLIAGRSLPGIVEALSRDGNPPLHYFLLHGWTTIFGSSEAAVRGLSALLGLALIPAVFGLMRSMFPTRSGAAIAAAAVVTVSPLHVYYSQEARMYSLTPLLGAGALWTLHRALETGRRSMLAAHAILLAAGLYTHNHFLFVLPLAPAAAVLAPGPRGRVRGAAEASGAVALAVLLWAPWVPVLQEQAASGVGAWIPGIWERTPPMLALAKSFEAMGVGGLFPGYLRELGLVTREVLPPAGWTIVRWIGAGLATFLVGLALAPRPRAADAAPPAAERVATLRLLLLLVLPLLLPWLASLLVRPVYLVGRYEMVGFVAFAGLVGLGGEASGARFGRAMRFGAAGVWVVLAAVVLAAYFQVQARAFPHELRIAQWLRGNASAGDVVVFPGLSRAVGEYYLSRWEHPADRRSFPAEVGKHHGWFDAGEALRDPAALDAEATDTAAALRDVVRAGHRAFLVDRPAGGAAGEVQLRLKRRLTAELGAPRPGWRPHPSREPSLVYWEAAP